MCSSDLMGSGVTLYVGVEGGFGSTVVPRLVGFPLKEAKGRLWELGLNVGKIDFDEGINLLNQKDARVYVQVPTAERSAALGSRVDLKLTLDEKKLAQHRATAEKQAREAAEELAERCHAEVVQVIGRKFSLYRESSRKDIEKIKLV